ncbi:hypothetical protein OL548_28515 [Lysinibacillus sp. MHQ-1]|nr:hypothetical protein OL548_28515 [Lysinibacillus sp. MHQ-1]
MNGQKIDWNGQSGWVSKDYVTINDSPKKRNQAKRGFCRGFYNNYSC